MKELQSLKAVQKLPDSLGASDRAALFFSHHLSPPSVLGQNIRVGLNGRRKVETVSHVKCGHRTSFTMWTLAEDLLPQTNRVEASQYNLAR